MKPRYLAGQPDSCFEHSDESFCALIKAIEALGYDRKTAGQYACWIGCTPIHDQDGKIVVQDDKGKVIDRIALDRQFPFPWHFRQANPS